MKGFNEKENIELINMIKENSTKGKTASSVFKEYALKTGRAVGSVRNHYYKLITKSKGSELLMEKLGISKELIPTFNQEFTKAESRDILFIIFDGLVKGNSVRKTVYDLANGNDKLAIRYQNKYRNILKNDREFLKQTAREYQEKTGKNVIDYLEIKKSKSSSIIQAENKINNLLDKILLNYEQENSLLKERVAFLSKENNLLKRIFKRELEEKSFTKDFFKNGIEIEKIKR